MYYKNLEFNWSFLGQQLKLAKLEPEEKLRELTICWRSYNLAYPGHGSWVPFSLFEGLPLVVETNGYSEPVTKSLQTIIYAPGKEPFDIVSWMWVSRQNFDISKTEWSFMRKTKKEFNSQEWHNVCIVYSVPKKTTGIVFNGEIVANRNQSEGWANEDNFISHYSFQPFKWVTLEDGNDYARYCISKLLKVTEFFQGITSK